MKITKITLPSLVATALILAFATPVFATSNKPEKIERWTRAHLMLAGYRNIRPGAPRISTTTPTGRSATTGTPIAADRHTLPFAGQCVA